MSSIKAQDEQVMYLRPFQLSWIKNYTIIVAIGRRGAGKSVLSSDLIHEFSKRGVPYGQIFSGTEQYNHFFSRFFPAAFIHKEFSDRKLKTIFRIQQKRMQRKAKQLGVSNGKCVETSFLLVLDDMMSEDDIWKRSKYFKKVFLEGRHVSLAMILNLQYVLGIPPPLRDNVDYVFLFANDDMKALKKMHENYAGVFPTFNMFRDVMAQCTQNHGCLVIDKTASGTLTDKVFYFRAKDPGRFKFGCPSMWKFHDNNYVDEGTSSEDEETLPSTSKRQRAQKSFETTGESKKKITVLMQNRY